MTSATDFDLRAAVLEFQNRHKVFLDAIGAMGDTYKASNGKPSKSFLAAVEAAANAAHDVGTQLDDIALELHLAVRN
jgi:hypothetical protein